MFRYWMVPVVLMGSAMVAFCDLASVAKNHESADERLAAMEKLDDQAVYAHVARNDSASFVRKAAVKGLNDQRLLASIAKQDEDANVRKAAIEKLDDQALLAEIAKDDELPEVRFAAIEHIRDQAFLVDLAKDATTNFVNVYTFFKGYELTFEKLTDATFLGTFAVKNRAAEGLNDQERLAEVVKTVNDHWVQQSAGKRITDQAILAELARHPNAKIRALAMEKLDDQKILADVVRNEKHPGVRYQALQRLDDQALLAYVAINDADTPSRRFAVERLHDQALLADVAKYSKDLGVRKKAVEKIGAQTHLAEVAVNAYDDEARGKAWERLTVPQYLDAVDEADEARAEYQVLVEGINDQEVYADVALNDDEITLRMAMIDVLTDQSALAEVVINDPEWKVRRAAMAKITDRECLADIIIHGNYETYQAVERLTDMELIMGAVRGLTNKTSDQFTFRSVLRKLDTPTFLSEFTMLSEGDNEQAFLADLAQNFKNHKFYWMVMTVAVERLDDQELLKEITKGYRTNCFTSIAAIGRIHDQAFLEDMAKNDIEHFKRKEAITQLDNIELLEDIAKSTDDKYLCSAANRRIQDLKRQKR